jgi:hypothetical protein
LHDDHHQRSDRQRFGALISLLRIAEGLRFNDIVSLIDPSFGNFEANQMGIQSGGSGKGGAVHLINLSLSQGCGG